MRRIKYLISIWILIITLISQSSALAFNIQDLRNTAPVANFTVEKSREVKLVVITDYTGADNANLQNSITSMRSELANYAKVNVEYAAPTDTTIGSQQGNISVNTWGKQGHASYRKSGYSWNVTPYGQSTWTDYNATPVAETFVYSNTIDLPEGQTPTTPYGVPTRYVKSSLNTSTANTMGPRYYYTFSFINNSGICAGKFDITTKYSYNFPNGATQELDISFSDPTFTYDDFWSVQWSTDTEVTNSVVGWDLSKLNLQVQDNTDTFVIFALNNENTNYYTSYRASNYRMGQLRSDSSIARYVRDSDARVYSICSDTLENTNLSTNPQYPITFSGAAQNMSLKDLIESSFDGRSIGKNNVTGLINKIKENVKRPSDKIDMVVATDKDISSTNSFVNSIKDNISSDVDLKSNVVNLDSLDNVDTWTKYVTSRDYKNVDTGDITDVNLIIAGNGDLWAQGNNSFRDPAIYEDGKYGLFGQSSTIAYYPQFIKIATNVKDAVFMDGSNGRSLTILKNDGTVWVTNYHYDGFTDKYYGSVKGIKSMFQGTGLYAYSIKFISNDGELLGDQYAPPDVQYMYCYYVYGGTYQIIYVTNDGSIYYRTYREGSTNAPAQYYNKIPSPIKEIGKKSGLIYCENKMLYDIWGNNLHGIKYKEVYLNLSQPVGIAENGLVYFGGGSTYGYGGFQKILFVEPGIYGTPGLIGIDLNGKLAYWGDILYSNLFDTSNYANAGKETRSIDNPQPFDASVNGTASDYLQVGSHFAYVTKKGEVVYIDNVYTGTDIYSGEAKYTFKTVNMGKADTAFDTSSKTVKAFSKTKIMNTTLRPGSERYFVYISDNIEKDTYFNEPSDYFLFGNLDSTLLNYLNANRFNIYIVTPAQARELKLQYPYVPVNRQQLSLKELLYNSVMDSAFCKDEDTVKKLIIKKYDSYTTQGSTSLTLLVNEESVRYNQIYSDFENDPKYADKWQYTHDPNYFDNSMGLDSYSGQWITQPLNTFSKVGKYTVVAQFRDNPKNDSRFDNYRLWSNTSAPATIYVHRRPIALFNTQVASKVGSTINLAYEDQSYDLDHVVSRTDKGIVSRAWKYKKSTSDTWIDGKPSSLTYNSGIYEIQLLVKDMEGVWSRPYVDTVNTANLPPTIDATPTTFTGAGPLNISITASDNGENDLVLAGSAISPKTRYALTNSTVQPTSGWTNLPSKVYSMPAITGDGTYYLHMEAYDTAGQRAYRVRGPYIIETIKAGQFYVTMMLDIGWRPYYFDMANGIDDNHDGEIDRYPRKSNTDIGTLKMPINYYSLVGHPRTYIKAGYRVKGKIDIHGEPDSAEFKIHYLMGRTAYTDTVPLSKDIGETYVFDWIIPLETDDKSFVSFDLHMRKGINSYGNEKWNDIWDARNTSRQVFYVRGKATDDLIYVQSQ